SYRGRRRGNLSINAGLTTSVGFYREILEDKRRSRQGLPGRLYSTGVLLVLAGLFVIVLPVGLSQLNEPGFSVIRAWIPFSLLLVVGGAFFLTLRRRDRRWLRREMDTLASLEKENQ